MASRSDVLSAAQRHLNVDPTASMAALAEAAGISRATLHRHVASREDLMREVGTRSLDRWAQSLDAVGVETVARTGDAAALEAALRDLLARFLADSDDFGFALTDTFMVHDPALRARSDSLVEREIELYAAAQAAGVLRSDVPARWIGHTVYGLLVAARDALTAGDIARRDQVDLVLGTLLAGLTDPTRQIHHHDQSHGATR